MATHRLPILGPRTRPDPDVFISLVKDQLTGIVNAPGEELCFVLPDVTQDRGIRGGFSVPKNYVGSPVLVIRGLIDGATGVNNIGFGVQMLGRGDNEPYDVALGTAALAQFQSDTHADEDIFEETITITESLAVDDDVVYWMFRDDSVTTYTGNLLITGLFFQYSDT